MGFVGLRTCGCPSSEILVIFRTTHRSFWCVAASVREGMLRRQVYVSMASNLSFEAFTTNFGIDLVARTGAHLPCCCDSYIRSRLILMGYRLRLEWASLFGSRAQFLWVFRPRQDINGLVLFLSTKGGYLRRNSSGGTQQCRSCGFIISVLRFTVWCCEAIGQPPIQGDILS